MKTKFISIAIILLFATSSFFYAKPKNKKNKNEKGKTVLVQENSEAVTAETLTPESNTDTKNENNDENKDQTSEKNNEIKKENSDPSEIKPENSKTDSTEENPENPAIKPDSPKIPLEPELLYLFKTSYPEITFSSQYDEVKKDWKITLEIPDENGSRTSTLYWCNGSFLPESEFEKKDEYWSLLYHYDVKRPLRDPATFTQEEIQKIKEYTAKDKRRNEYGTPMFFFDEIYDSNTRTSLERHIVKTTFLGLPTNVHQLIKNPLKQAEEKILEAAKTDSEIQKFIDFNSKIEGYYWRYISGTKRKSFHSLGIAIDITPTNYQGKSVYWSWTRDWNPDKWMLTPINKRWAPPQKVIDILEEYGFIWGGKWVIWDNMHFEYHPELIQYSLYEEAEAEKNGETGKIYEMVFN